jgi:hypothetical protein
VARHKGNIVGKNQTRQGRTRNFEKTNIREVTLEGPGTQQWHKEPRPETAALKQEGIDQNIQGNHWTGDCKANCQIYCQIAKNEELDIVERSAFAKKEEGPTSTVSIR